MPATFTRMDESTLEDWMEIGAQTSANQGRVADRMLDLLGSLTSITDGFGTDQLTHCLQTATMAERAGADEEVVFAALMHDVGKAISVPNHPAIAAEMIRPYVRPAVYKTADAQGTLLVTEVASTDRRKELSFAAAVESTDRSLTHTVPSKNTNG